MFFQKPWPCQQRAYAKKRPCPTFFMKVHIEQPPHLPVGTVSARIVLISRLKPYPTFDKAHPTFSRAAVSPACWWPCQAHALTGQMEAE